MINKQLSQQRFEEMLSISGIFNKVHYVASPIFRIDVHGNVLKPDDNITHKWTIGNAAIWAIDGTKNRSTFTDDTYREITSDERETSLFELWFKNLSQYLLSNNIETPLYFYRLPELIIFNLLKIDPITYEMGTFEAQNSLINGHTLDLEKPVFTLNDVKKIRCADVIARVFFEHE